MKYIQELYDVCQVWMGHEMEIDMLFLYENNRIINETSGLSQNSDEINMKDVKRRSNNNNNNNNHTNNNHTNNSSNGNNNENSIRLTSHSLSEVINTILESAKIRDLTCADIKSILTQCHLLIVRRILDDSSSNDSNSGSNNTSNSRDSKNNSGNRINNINNSKYSLIDTSLQIRPNFDANIFSTYLHQAFQLTRPSLSYSEKDFFKQIYNKFQGIDSINNMSIQKTSMK